MQIQRNPHTYIIFTATVLAVVLCQVLFSEALCPDRTMGTHFMGSSRSTKGIEYHIKPLSTLGSCVPIHISEIIKTLCSLVVFTQN